MLFFVIQSCDDETSNSNEEVEVDTTAPVLTIPIHAVNRTQNQMTLSWMTDERSTAILTWEGDSLSDSLLLNDLDTNFTAILTNLELGSEYIITLTVINELELESTVTDTFYTLIADFALYDGTGAWPEGVLNEKNLLDEIGYSWTIVTEDDINAASLYPYYKALWMPGGWAGDYKNVISSYGEENIDNFIRKGNFYIGSCAGGYYASDSTIWEDVHYDNPLDFFNGYAIGPLNELAIWPSYIYTTVNLNNEFEALETLPDSIEMLYYGGAYYQPVGSLNENAIVMAQYSHNNEVMALLEPIGKGYYFISGCHPEVRRVSKPDAWPFMSAVIDWAMERVRIELP